uniref:Uncharacterized protein n=1 Tax=Cacopsylla melanoneura TaxID=428564 RepID=A0A8D8PPJ0_9HEMI
MSHVTLDGTQQKGGGAVLAEHVCDGVYFLWVSHLGTSTVGLHITNISRIHSRLSVHLLDQFLLHAPGRERDALLLGAVSVAPGVHHRGVRATGGGRLLNEQNHARFGPDVTIAGHVESFAHSLRGQHVETVELKRCVGFE